ncbi:MAG: DUF4296 domain-containing protein [Prevotella sp.]|nr:DUF4296 domain-containing protein [Prevotella sp.]
MNGIGKYRNLLLPAIMVLLLVASCKPGVPKECIQPDEMEDILYDYHLSQALAYRDMGRAGNLPQNANTPIYRRELYYHAVLRKHGVTEAEFDSSLVYYYSNAEELHKIYKRVSERMEKSAIALGANTSDINKFAQLSENGDTANIWHDATFAVMTPAPPYNRFDFKIEGDSTFRRGDAFLLNFVADFIYQGGTKDAVAYLAVKYDNDSISTHVTHISVSGVAQLRVPENMSNTVKDISGFIYLNRGTDGSNTVKLLFVNQIQLIRFHKKSVEEPADTIASMSIDTTAVVQNTTPTPKQMTITMTDTVRKPLSHSGEMKRMRPLQHAVRERETEKSGSK